VTVARQYILYLGAKGIPGTINFLGLYLFTRLLTPQEYGNYILVVSVVSFFNAVIFQWIRLGLLRYYPAYLYRSRDFMSTVVTVYFVIYLAVIIIGIGLYFFWPNQELRLLFVFGAIILCAQSAYEANLELHRSQLEVKIYGFLSLTRAVLGFVISVLFIHWGYGAKGVLVGLLLGYLSAVVTGLSYKLSAYSALGVNRKILLHLFKYGGPLSATFLLEFIVSSSDRLLLGWLIDPATAGAYAAGYDLSVQTIGLLISVINLAAYPLAIRALETGGPERSRQQLLANGTLLFSVSIPLAVGMILLSSNINRVVLGPAFQKTGELLMPWIVISALIAGIKAFHFDLSFQLGQKTVGQIWVVASSALVNVGLNMWLIPKLGIMGAAYSTFAAYAVGLFLSWSIGRQIFRVPVPWVELVKIAVAAIVMALVIIPIIHMQGAWALTIQIFAGGAVYLVMAFVLNIGNCKSKLFCKNSYASK
jgi:O-antigen/teichoic acid export membrane protein